MSDLKDLVCRCGHGVNDHGSQCEQADGQKVYVQQCAQCACKAFVSHDSPLAQSLNSLGQQQTALRTLRAEVERLTAEQDAISRAIPSDPRYGIDLLDRITAVVSNMKAAYERSEAWEVFEADMRGKLSASEAKLRAVAERFDLTAHLHRQREFSERMFGPGQRTEGVIDHITKELSEIRRQPDDVSEWIDVVLLALDGAWRHGFTPEQIVTALAAKQAKNEARTWPDWRTAPSGKAIEHDRSGDDDCQILATGVHSHGCSHSKTELSAILTPPPSHYVLFPTDAFVQGGKQCFTFTGITACDPRTTFRDQTVAIRGQKWRVVSVETYAVPDPTGMNFGLIVEPLAQ